MIPFSGTIVTYLDIYDTYLSYDTYLGISDDTYFGTI